MLGRKLYFLQNIYFMATTQRAKFLIFRALRKRRGISVCDDRHFKLIINLFLHKTINTKYLSKTNRIPNWFLNKHFCRSLK